MIQKIKRHFEKYSYNYQAALGVVLTISIVFFLISTISYNLEAKHRINHLEQWNIEISNRLGSQTVDIIELKDLLDEQQVLMYYYQQQITDNLEGININSKRITTNAIEIDQSSLEGLKTIIEEFEDDLEHLRKKVDHE